MLEFLLPGFVDAHRLLPGSVDAYRSLDYNYIWYPIVLSLPFPFPASMYTPHQTLVDTTTVCGRASSFPFPWIGDDKETERSEKK